MNTIRSFWFGWGSVCVAGAGAYYFAKKEINADRLAKLDSQRRAKDAQRTIEYSQINSGSSTSNFQSSPATTDSAGSPSRESNNDPAATRHAPATEAQRLGEKSKYEASTAYRSPKGDRL